MHYLQNKTYIYLNITTNHKIIDYFHFFIIEQMCYCTICAHQ
jgi:hypothetical protein